MRMLKLPVLAFWLGPLLVVSMGLSSGCSAEQLRANTYEALHKHQQVRCREEGRADCSEYERYPDYRNKRDEVVK